MRIWSTVSTFWARQPGTGTLSPPTSEGIPSEVMEAVAIPVASPNQGRRNARKGVGRQHSRLKGRG